MNRKNDESAEEWTGRLGIEATESNYKENIGQLKEHFINGINNASMTGEKNKRSFNKTLTELAVMKSCCWLNG